MEQAVVISLLGKAIILTLVLALPLVIPALVIGLAVSIFQALTQIQDSSLSFVPKLIVVLIMLVVLGGWLFDKILNFSREVFRIISQG